MITRFDRKKIDDVSIYGLIIKRSRSLVLIHREVDFAYYAKYLVDPDKPVRRISR